MLRCGDVDCGSSRDQNARSVKAHWPVSLTCRSGHLVGHNFGHFRECAYGEIMDHPHRLPQTAGQRFRRSPTRWTSSACGCANSKSKPCSRCVYPPIDTSWIVSCRRRPRRSGQPYPAERPWPTLKSDEAQLFWRWPLVAADINRRLQRDPPCLVPLGGSLGRARSDILCSDERRQGRHRSARYRAERARSSMGMTTGRT
jgi:hypothetical protein